MKNTHFAAVATGLAVLAAMIANSKPAHSQSEVGFRLIRDSSIILVPVVVNGQGPFEFIFDTGADDVVVDTSLVKRLALRSAGSAHQATIAGAWAPDRSEAESLQLGSARTEETPVLLADLSNVRAAVPEAMGILGQAFLAHFNYLLDYRQSSIRFEQGDEIRESVHGIPLPATFARHRMIVHAEIGTAESVAVRLLLDSGANALVLTRDSADAARVFLHAAGFETTANAKVALPTGRIPEITFGSERLHNLPVAVSPGGRMQPFCDGFLPTSIFKALYVNNRLGFVEIEH
jgi:predicted aspartyl protease